MNYTIYTPLLIIGLTVVSSFIGFGDRAFFDRHKFNVGGVLKGRQWDRLITSSALHGDYMHLLFNMMTLYFFSDTIIEELGVWKYLAIYFVSILFGGLLSLFIHRKDYYYSAIGASGGVVGILFASIAINPHIGIGMLFIPVYMPGWLFGVAYLLFSIYGMFKQADNIGHDAHLGGAAAGLCLAVAFSPELLIYNGLYIAILSLPVIILGYFV